MNLPLLKTARQSIDRIMSAVPLGFWQQATHFNQWEEEECFIAQLARYLKVESAEAMAERLKVPVGDIVLVYQIYPKMMCGVALQPDEELRQAFAAHGLVVTWEDQEPDDDDDEGES